MGTLRLICGDLDRDPPVAWDGEPVRWSEEAVAAGTIFMCPPPPVPDACTGCGQLTADGADIYFGKMRGPDAGPYWDRDKQGRPRQIPAWETWPIRLVLTRCLGCGLDRVTDIDTDECWDLDESDYGPDGSVPPPERPIPPPPVPAPLVEPDEPDTPFDDIGGNRGPAPTPTRAEAIAAARAALAKARGE